MDISGLEKLLYSGHAMLASLTKTQELMLEQGEAQVLASAIAGVAEHYDLGGVMPPETLAWVNLVQVAGVIYGPRIFAARMRKRVEAAQQQGQYQ